jgi:hypothetical protein
MKVKNVDLLKAADNMLWDRLGDTTRLSILKIVKELEGDAYYLPKTGEHLYSVENHPKDYLVCCQHVSDWEGYQMFWYFEYSPIEHTKPVRVKVGLQYQQSPKLVVLKPRDTAI